MNDLPLITIILAVFNSEKFVDRAIQSILNQNYTNFELIVIDDCSTDSSFRIISGFKDPRIKLFKNKTNIGLAGSLNKAIKCAKGEYIARMDSDDICMKQRFELQIEFLEKRKTIDICGGYIGRIDANDKIIKRISRVPTSDSKIKARSILAPQFFHPTVVFRTDFLIKNSILYNEHFNKAQDFEMWSRIIFETNVTLANIPSRLIFYRDEQDKKKKQSRNEQQFQMANIVREKNLTRLNILNKHSFSVLNKFMHGDILSKFEFYRLCILLTEINHKSKNKFNAYPKLNNTFPLNHVKGHAIIFFFTKKLYRNLVFKKNIKQILNLLIQKNKLNVNTIFGCNY